MQYYSVALNKRLFSAPVHAGWAQGVCSQPSDSVLPIEPRYRSDRAKFMPTN